MVSAFLLLIPFVPYAAFRLTASEPRPALPSAPLPAPPPAFDPVALPGAPASPDSGGPFSPLSARSVREMSRGWTWKGLETPGWKLLMADHFVVRGDVPIDDLRTVGAYLEQFLKMIQPRLGGDASGLMFSARVFAQDRDFRRYAARLGAANAESLYDPQSAEIVVCLDGPRSSSWLQKTLAHEFTHEYMDRVWHRTGPLWFAEGMAEYFSNFTVREGRLVPGAVDPRALLLLRIDPPLPLAAFLKLPRDEMYGVAFAHHYAQAWSLVHYLFTRPDGVVDLLLRGDPLPKLDEIERLWLKHVEELK